MKDRKKGPIYRPASRILPKQWMLTQCNFKPQLALPACGKYLSSRLQNFPFALPGCIIPQMLGDRTNREWIEQYATSHQHPVNRICHTLGIPLILLSLALFAFSILFHSLWRFALGLFLLGWVFQFVGHAFEGKSPEFFHDWRFLFVGVRWWWAKLHGKA